MYRIRLHGRGGQGIKTASRILGSAFFAEGFEVQDAPRYGAERRGAPIFAYVRADRVPVDERGPIERPDLVVVADESLLQVPAAGVLAGLTESTLLLISSGQPAGVWRDRLGVSGSVLRLPRGAIDDPARSALLGAACVGAAARLIGCISETSLEDAIRSELEDHSAELVERNVAHALESFASFAEHAGRVIEGVKRERDATDSPAWVQLELEPTSLSAPDIHGGPTSERVATGLWRTMRPEIDDSLCNRCSWICSTLCPDGAIDVGAAREPIIDYDHCKGCMLCVAVCPTHAIRAEPEAASPQLRREP
jgi:pyruvate ferredoxin oxidoreductase gamma subunit